MTRLSYKVGTVNCETYNEALELSHLTGLPVERVYTPIEEHPVVDPIEREKRVAAIREKALKKERI